MERVTALGEAQGMTPATPRIRKRVDLTALAEGPRWWRDDEARD